MKILDPGHLYSLDTLDGDADLQDGFTLESSVTLRFVKRIGVKYPGNDPPGYDGTTTQEVLRALIDRTKYVDKQDQHTVNISVLYNLRSALYALERRAAERRGEPRALDAIRAIDGSPDAGIEAFAKCETCGHIKCSVHG